MNLLRSRSVAVLVAGAFTLAACSADRQSSFAPSSSTAAAAAAAGENAGVLNVAGEYAGSVNDGSVSGHARGSISQFGASAGGPIAFTLASKKRANAAAVTLDSDGSMRGTMVATVAQVACTFKLSASYDDSKHVLSGSFRAVHECSGDSGTFSLKERCYYVLRADIRRDIGGLKPC